MRSRSKTCYRVVASTESRAGLSSSSRTSSPFMFMNIVTHCQCHCSVHPWLSPVCHPSSILLHLVFSPFFSETTFLAPTCPIRPSITTIHCSGSSGGYASAGRMSWMTMWVTIVSAQNSCRPFPEVLWRGILGLNPLNCLLHIIDTNQYIITRIA